MMPAPLILRLDVTGSPLRWIPWEDAVCLYARGQVAWTAGENEFEIRGGECRATGTRSRVIIHSIVAVKRSARGAPLLRTQPPLSNHELFRRDECLCMYCGGKFPEGQLTRDHVIPLSRGGEDVWSNVVSACRHCNMRKGCHTPEQASMPLLAVPYVPNWAEFLALSNRRILADQMEFLKTRFRRQRRGEPLTPEISSGRSARG
jgi:5-methylcytosine-specific restriction endonuclease McrA